MVTKSHVASCLGSLLFPPFPSSRKNDEDGSEERYLSYLETLPVSSQNKLHGRELCENELHRWLSKNLRLLVTLTLPHLKLSEDELPEDESRKWKLFQARIRECERELRQEVCEGKVHEREDLDWKILTWEIWRREELEGNTSEQKIL